MTQPDPNQSVAKQLKDILKEAIACNQYLDGDTSYMKDSALDEYVMQLKALLLDAQIRENDQHLSFNIDEVDANKPDYAAGFADAIDQLEMYREKRIKDLTSQKNQLNKEGSL